jgi:hypothetical protein
MNNLTGYPHHLDAEWTTWVPASPGEVQGLLFKMRRMAMPQRRL